MSGWGHEEMWFGGRGHHCGLGPRNDGRRKSSFPGWEEPGGTKSLGSLRAVGPRVQTTGSKPRAAGVAAHGQGFHCGVEPCWGSLRREKARIWVRQACAWARFYFLFPSRGSYCTCLAAPVFPYCQLCSTPAVPSPHTWRSCHSQALTPLLAPRSEPAPDFPVLLLERLVQEHVDEQDAAPPGDSRSH